ncbi:DUF3179 domain-containing protein [soil metagenome]
MTGLNRRCPHRRGGAFSRRAVLIGAGAGILGTWPLNLPAMNTMSTLAQGATPTAVPIEDSDSFRFATSGWATDFSMHSVPLDEIRPGGPGKDGIAPIDSPGYESIAEADQWLEPLEPVVSVALEGSSGPAARAYPIQILIWHEIVNDLLGGQPVLATFCPLCNTAIAFDRRLEGEPTIYDFGTTGNLRFSDLVMWDRQTESWWQQLTGEAIVGTLTGSRLSVIPAQILGWQTFKEQYPFGDVLSIETGFSRPYGSNPYSGYDDVNASPFLFDQQADGRLLPMERVVGVELGVEQAAYLVGDIAEPGAINDVLDGKPVVILLSGGSVSATDAGEIAASREVGQAGAFLREAGGQVLTFAIDSSGNIVDEETASVWSVTGRAEVGPLADTQLTAIPHVVAFWFSWAAAFPETRLWTG